LKNVTDKTKNEKYHTVGTVPKCNRTILETEGKSLPLIQIPGLVQALQ
jgi:hypothetical protein